MKTHPFWWESLGEKTHFLTANQSMNMHSNATLHRQDGHDSRPSAHQTHRPVSFFCAAPQAGLVELVGDFNHWHPLPMNRAVDGWWHARVELRHGHHQYRFLVDGQPTLDPQATGIVRDDHDEPASLIAVS
jgi:1,4-alpha-glucan branching enzyme